MEGTPAIYLGRIVDKKNFRAFIYGVNGERRLVNSWEEFEANMQSGLWFASEMDAIESKTCSDAVEEPPIDVKQPPVPKLKTKDKSKVNASKEPPQKAQKIPDDGMGFEVKNGE